MPSIQLFVSVRSFSIRVGWKTPSNAVETLGRVVVSVIVSVAVPPPLCARCFAFAGSRGAGAYAGHMSKLQDHIRMRWQQALVYAVGALLFVGAAASWFEPRSVALAFGLVLMVLSLGDGPRGLVVFCRDVKRHVVGR